jgi:peptidoglycan/xylan/chitin deacetylase (PgdA/CDA1 family)
MLPLNRLKVLAVRALDASGAGVLLRPWLAGRGAILAMHRVLAPEQPTLQPGNAVTAAYLREVLRLLRRRKYEIVSMDELPARLRARNGRRAAAITFDDGYLDNLLHAAPVCAEFDAPFCVFATAGLIDRTVLPWWVLLEEYVLRNDRAALEHPSAGRLVLPCATDAEKTGTFRQLLRIAFAAPAEMLAALRSAYAEAGMSVEATVDRNVLSRDQLARLASHPLATIGAHSVSHPALKTLPEAEAAFEMEESRRRLRDWLGIPVRHFAYPFGSPLECGPREFRLARELGFATAATTTRGTLRGSGDLFALPRICLSAIPHAATMAYPRLSLDGVWNGLANWWIGRRA